MLEVSTNGGKLFTNQKATAPNDSEVWYNPNTVINIFSLSEMEKKHRITYDSAKEKAFTVHLPNKEVKFIKSLNGLYYHKPRYGTSKNKDKTPVNHTIIPITASVKIFSHVMIAGVDDNIMISGVDENINFAGMARNTTKHSNINTSKLAEISKHKPSKTLVEFMENNTQAKNQKKMTMTSSKLT
jgi:hypothetical protein